MNMRGGYRSPPRGTSAKMSAASVTSSADTEASRTRSLARPPVAHRERVHQGLAVVVGAMAPGRCARELEAGRQAPRARRRRAPAFALLPARLPAARSGRPPAGTTTSSVPVAAMTRAKLRGRASTEDRKREIDGTVGEREAAVGVRDDPGEIGRKPSRETDRRSSKDRRRSHGRPATRTGARSASPRRSRRRARTPDAADLSASIRDASAAQSPSAKPSASHRRRAATASSRSPASERTAVLRLEQVRSSLRARGRSACPRGQRSRASSARTSPRSRGRCSGAPGSGQAPARELGACARTAFSTRSAR